MATRAASPTDGSAKQRHGFTRLIGSPIFPGEDEKTRVAGLLHPILLTILAAAFVSSLLILLASSSTTLYVRLISTATLVVLIGTMLVLVHRGQVRLASILTLAGLWVIGTLAIVIGGGGIRSLGFSSNIILVIMASILLGRRAGFGMAFISIMTGLAFVYARSRAWISDPPLPDTDIEIWVSQAVYLTLAAFLLGMTLRGLDYALTQAHREIQDRKDAEQAVREREEQYRLIFNSVQDAIFVESLDGRILSVNDRACELYGYTREEFLTKTVADIVPPGQPMLFLNGEPVSTSPIESINLRANGEPFPIEVSGRKQTINGENVQVVIIHDLTGRKRAEQTLRESEERFHSAFEFAAIGMALVSLDGHWLKVNHALCEIVGYSETELLSKTFQDITHPDDIQADLAYVQEMLEGTRQSYQMQKRYFHRRGQVVWVLLSVSIVRNGQGRSLYFISQIQDITRLKEAEEGMRRHVDRLNALQETLLEITSRNSLSGLLNSIVERAASLLNAPGGGLYLAETDQRQVRCVVSYRTKRDYTGTILKYGEGAAGYVAQTGKSLIIADYASWRGQAQTFAEGLPFHRVMSAPLLWQEQVTGVIHVLRDAGAEPFTPDDLTLLELFANHAAVAVENARLFDETNERVLELETLQNVSASLRTVPSIEEALPIILDETLKSLNTEAGVIALYNPARQMLEVRVRRGWFDQIPIHSRKPGEGITGTVFLSGQPHISEEFSTDPLVHPSVRGYFPQGWGGACVPIRTTSETIGVIFVSVKFPHQVNPSHVNLLTALADMTGAALQRMILHEETSRRVEEFSALYQTSTVISGEHELTLLLHTIVEEAASLLKASSGALYLFDTISNELTLMVSTEPSIPVGIHLQPGEGIAGRVAETRQPMRIDDYSAWEYRSEKYKEVPIRSVIDVPVMFGGELIGVLVAQEVGESQRKFSDADERLLSLFASQAGGAIRSARLYDESVRRINYLQTLRSIDHAITANMDSNVTLKILLNLAVSQARIDAVSILLFDRNTLRLEYRLGQGFRTRDNQKASIRLGENYAGVVALERRMISLSELSEVVEGPFKEFLLEESFQSGHLVPMIAKGQVLGVMQAFTRDHLPASREWIEFLEALATQAAIAIDNSQLFQDLQQANFEMSLAYDATIERWSAALEKKLQVNEDRTKQIIEWTIQLAREAGLEEKTIGHIRRGVILHDIGNMTVPDHILLKPSALTNEEWEIVRHHPTRAYEMLNHVQFLRPALDIPYCHHERWDGSGYPRGLFGEQIPLAARIFAVVDVWDALTSNRPYRKAWTKKKALAYIRARSGKHFDPKVVELFLRFVSKMDEDFGQDRP